MKLSVAKKMSFAAAHSLPNYDGPCQRLHGHEWVIEVEVTGEVDEKTGMVIDFVKLKKVMQDKIINVLDHEYINDHFQNPTAENMVIGFKELIEQYFIDVELTRISLWETPTSVCTWRK